MCLCEDAAEPGRGLRRILTPGRPVTDAKVAAAAARALLQPMCASGTPRTLLAAGGPPGGIQPSPLYLDLAADVIKEPVISTELPNGASQS